MRFHPVRFHPARFHIVELFDFVFVLAFGLCALSRTDGLSQPVFADEPQQPAPLGERVRAALERGLPLVEQAAMRYPEHRKCFSCHHQTLPLVAITAARDAGVVGDQSVVKAQAEFTHTAFAGQLDNLRAGEGIGGRALTVGYGLWALKLADWQPDLTTEALVTYLVKTQQDDGCWKVQTVRPPLEESSATATVLAVAGLRRFGPAETGENSQLKHEVDAAVAKAQTWLLAAEPKSTEDKVARLWGLHQFEAADAVVRSGRDLLLASQRDDGGWPQLDEMPGDAYATGQALAVLMATGLAQTSPECQRGVEFLLATQRDDGSWFVKSRSKPIQVMFDNGDPHGTDQFISTPATCWALTALALSQRK